MWKSTTAGWRIWISCWRIGRRSTEIRMWISVINSDLQKKTWTWVDHQTRLAPTWHFMSIPNILLWLMFSSFSFLFYFIFVVEFFCFSFWQGPDEVIEESIRREVLPTISTDNRCLGRRQMQVEIIIDQKLPIVPAPRAHKEVFCIFFLHWGHLFLIKENSPNMLMESNFVLDHSSWIINPLKS